MNDIVAGTYSKERRKEERRGRIGGLTDALNQIYLAVNSSIDFNERMNRVVFESAKAIYSESAGIAIRSDNFWTIKYAWGLPRELAEKSFTDNEFQHAVIAETTQKPVAISDTFNDDRVNQDVMRTLRIRSTMVIPLITRGKVKGMLFFNYHSAIITFSEALIDFADKAGILVALSLENSELNEDLMRKQTEIRLEKELSRALTNINMLIHLTSDPDKILKLVIEEAAKAVGAESAMICVIKEGLWEVRHVYKLSAELPGKRFTSIEMKHAALAAETAEPVVVCNVAADGRVDHDFTDKFNISSLLGCPLVARGEAIGGLVFHWHSGPAVLNMAHIDFAGRLADSVSFTLDKNLHLAELEQYNDEFNVLNNMNILLQAGKTIEEFDGIIAESVSQLFPSDRGIVYMLDESKTTLQTIATWGDKKIEGQILSPDKCWALKLGKIYSTDDPLNKKVCAHPSRESQTADICVPMTEQNKNIGLFYLELKCTDASKEKQSAEHKKNLAEITARSIALSLVNLKLREDREQSLIDPLTETFNGTYMHHLFERELHRSARTKSSLGIIVLAVDHFREFHDTYGREAQDALLRKIGVFIMRRIRAEDIACRRGEGFVIILPDTSSDICRQRAERLRTGVKQLSYPHPGQGTRRLTLSLGVAAFPKDGLTQEELFRAAEAALYRARVEGRDRVVTAGEKSVSPYTPEHFDKK